jgi:hypothetical protein
MNFVKSSLNARIFAALRADLGADRKTLDSNVSLRLSKENMLNQLYEL